MATSKITIRVRSRVLMVVSNWEGGASFIRSRGLAARHMEEQHHKDQERGRDCDDHAAECHIIASAVVNGGEGRGYLLDDADPEKAAVAKRIAHRIDIEDQGHDKGTVEGPAR